MPKIQIPEKLQPFITKKKRFKIAYGGRGGAKSQSFADMLLLDSQVNGSKIACFREFQNSIDDSVHALLKSEIDRLSLEGFNVVNTKIDNNGGGGFRFKGLARSPTAVKSMFGFKKYWIEEAQDISEESLRVLTPTAREEDAELWFSLNPQSAQDPISQRFLEPFKKELDRDGYYEDDLHYIVKINYYDNPWFPEALEQERAYDYENMPRALYDHVWLGGYNDTVDNAIILPEWFDAAVDAHKKLGFEPRGRKVVAFDPSDEGADDKALVTRHGSVITAADVMATGDSADGMDWAIETTVAEQADLFNWDCDGLGVALKRHVQSLLEGKRTGYAMFKGSESPDRPHDLYDDPSTWKDKEQHQRTNAETFRNKRAQYAWALRDRFFNTYRAVVKGEYKDPDTMISISGDIELLAQLRSEVCRIPKKHNSNGLIQIMSKPDMAKLKIKSPNLFDAMMMSMRVEEQAEYSEEPYYDNREGRSAQGGY